ncbi:MULTISPECIES: transcriptional repressor [unclassified Halanaerobium]|uniref:Fur family transcriptional regulator n=1 Tax=unclassified Halanaerobium TaxID=2641197 RepID=UPI000DF2B09C|nr:MULTISPECIES: transcriptional repressor [unclassified Halanaerobium]RCW51369.1 Fur family peroxide stress response transcriptional regulator [Halanaerobium sp. MA284_MarDTE_T2]RCW81432.1 Fur family peroxide stress response transcriptional regulator [Halanaerobium sp. DL-01]
MTKNTRMTKQRKAILRVLKNTESHPTADWIYEQVKKEIPNISLGTVYRNLNVLSELGKIQILDYGSTYSRYDGNPKNHYHFRCEKCGRVYDIHIDLFDDINKIVNEKTAFQVNEHRLEFTGLCPICQNEN